MTGLGNCLYNSQRAVFIFVRSSLYLLRDSKVSAPHIIIARHACGASSIAKRTLFLRMISYYHLPRFILTIYERIWTPITSRIQIRITWNRFIHYNCFLLICTGNNYVFSTSNVTRVALRVFDISSLFSVSFGIKSVN